MSQEKKKNPTIGMKQSQGWLFDSKQEKSDDAETNGKEGLHQSRTTPIVDGESTVGRTRLKKLLADQGYKCALSGRQMTAKTASLDHKHPISRGGSNEPSNVQFVVDEVNLSKGTMTNEEFIILCLDVVNHARASGVIDSIAGPRAAQGERSILSGAG